MRDQSAETGFGLREGDLDLIADLGVAATRFPVLWEHVGPRDPRDRDFSAAVRRARRLRERAVEPIVTLLHHGSGPLYTDLLDPAFADLFADYAEAAATALPWVKRWTPINEPLTTARFSTLYGVWFPNARDDRAFGRAMVHQTLAVQLAMERIRTVNPDAQLVLTEDLQRFTAADADVRAYVEFLRHRSYLSVDLLCGSVTSGHPLFDFLVERCGVARGELAEIAARAVPPQLVAFNHYAHSERYVFTAADGTIGDVPAVYIEGEPPPSAGPLLRAAAQRLRLPLALGEVHVNAPAHERVRWLAQHVADVDALRADGIDVRAVGVWAAFGMIDWHSLLRRRIRIIEDGIYTFAGPNGTPQPTALSEAVALLARGGRSDAGEIRGWWERAERLLTREELLALRDRGIPEGDHILAAGRALV
ncbi:MAG: hypothetical protein NVS3B28_14290 [Candidatus Velthaea sp.]